MFNQFKLLIIYSPISLPYTDAFLMEIQRHCLVTPLTPQHFAMKETQLLGYTIPKVYSHQLLFNQIEYC